MSDSSHKLSSIFLKVFMQVLLKILTITCGKYVFFSYKAAYSMVTCIVTCLETC